MLRRAKALLTPDRWLQGWGAILGDKMCVGCAIMESAGLERDFCQPGVDKYFAAFDRAVSAITQPASMPMMEFNARPDITHADLMSAFDRAIELAERRPA